MIDDTTRRPETREIRSTFDQFLQDKGKGRSGDGGNYRRNVARELSRFHEWASGDQDGDWTGIVPDGADREPVFGDLSTRVFREYARQLSGDRGLKHNTVQTYYAYLSAWCGWCVREGYLDAHYAQRAGARAPLPDDDGRRPGDQQAWSPEQRHALTRHVDRVASEAIEAWATSDAGPTSRERYEAIKAARDRALVVVVAYTAVRIGEIVRDPDDPRRRGLRWGEVDLSDGSMEVYRKKQSWDAASLPEPVVGPLERYRRVVDPPSDRWPVFPTLDRETLADRVTETLADRGCRPSEIERRRDEYARDLLAALDIDARPPSVTTDGARRILRRVTEAADVEVTHPKHEYLAPHGGRRGMGEVLVRAFGYTVAARYLDNSEAMIRERYSHIEAGELGDLATEALAGEPFD